MKPFPALASGLHRRPLLWLVLLAALLPGCSTVPKPSALTHAETDRQRLSALPYWKAEGRLGVQSPEGAWNANLFWEHDGRQDRLRISGPFNQGVISIVVQDDLIYINEGNGVTETARNADEALQRRLGFTVPVTSLHYWLLGLPAPHSEFRPMETAAEGAQGFVQQGWSLIFDRYTPFAGSRVPTKSSIRGERVKLKLIVDNWSTRKTS